MTFDNNGVWHGEVASEIDPQELVDAIHEAWNLFNGLPKGSYMNDELYDTVCYLDSELCEILELIEEKCGSLKNYFWSIHDISYKYAFDILKNSYVFPIKANEEIKAVWIFQPVEFDHERLIMHIITFDNRYKWGDYFNKQIIPMLKEEGIKTVYGYLNENQKAVVRLYKRYGYEPEWVDHIKRYKYTIKLD